MRAILASGILAALLLAGCSRQRDEDGAPRSAAGDQRAVSVASLDGVRSRTTKAPVAATHAVAQRGGLLGLLPQDTLLALRFPDFGTSATAVRESVLGRVVAAPPLAGLRDVASTLSDRWFETWKDKLPAGLSLEQLVGLFQGECVIALTEVHPWLMQTPGRSVPFTLAVYLDLGDSGPVAEQLLARAFEGSPPEKRADGTLWYRHDTDSGNVSVVFDGKHVYGWVGPGGVGFEKYEPWLKLRPEQSFLAARVVAEAPQPNTGGPTLFEAFLNLEPVWQMVRPLAPPQATTLIQQTRLENLKGLSLVSWIENGVIREIFDVHSPGNLDIFSRLSTGATVDPAWTRWLDGAAGNQICLALDIDGGFQKLRSVLPAEAKSVLDQEVHGLEKTTGVNLYRDVFDNLGPQIGLSLDSVDPTDPGSLGLLVAIQVKNEHRAESFLAALLKRSGLERRLGKTGAQSYFLIEVPSSAAGSPQEMAYTLKDKVLLFSTDVARLERVLTLVEPARAHKQLQQCIAEAGGSVLSVTYSSIQSQVRSFLELFRMVQGVQGMPEVTLPSQDELNELCAGLPDSLAYTISREPGLRVESRSATGTFIAGSAAAAAAIGASLMIPMLMDQRNDANEQTVADALRLIYAAQVRFKEDCAVDTDHDGIGEYGYFGELTGAVAIRSSQSKAGIHYLEAGFSQVHNGCVLNDGYVYRIDLPGPQGYPYPESIQGGTNHTIPADDAEGGFVVYAWPLDSGSTGLKVFALDESGELFAADNLPPNQGYSGFTRVPAGDAAFLSAGSNREKGIRSVRRGRDGALWLKLDP